MKSALVTAVLPAALLVLAPLAFAQSKGAAAPGSSAADPVQTCVACHGGRGEGNPAGGFPRIAGQSQAYLLHQLESYANGTRRNPVMEPIAKGLAPAARVAVADHYARLQPPPAAPAAKAAANERGALLADRGDEGRQLQACNNCHGPGGTGEPPKIPYLAGLDAAYLAAQLNAFKGGTRRNDAGQQMRLVARALLPADIEAVSQHYAGRPPPAQRAPPDIVRAPAGPGPTRAATPSSSQQPAAPGGTVGADQGAPTSGGTQGPGGVDQGSRVDKPAPTKNR